MTKFSKSLKDQNLSEYITNEKEPVQSIETEQDEELIYGWVIILGTFLMFFGLFGIFGSFGVFLKEYKNLFPSTSASVLSLIGSSGSSIFSFLGIICARLSDYIPYKACLTLGSTLFCLGLLMASFATKVWHLFITHSLLLGIGSSIVFFPAVSAPPQWFTRHRGLAMGIAMSGAGFGGLAFGPIIQLLFDSLGFRWTLRILSPICFVLQMISVALLKERLTVAKPKQWINFKLIMNQNFFLLFGMGFFISFSYWVPFFLIPLYSTYHGIFSSHASLLVGLLNFGSAIGRILLGRIADKVGNINMAIISFLVMTLSCFVIWPFSTVLPSLVVFTLIFGASSSGLFVFLPILSAQIFGVENQSQVNGPLFLSMSISFLLGSPLATAILHAASPSEKIQKFVPSIIFAGAMSLIGCCFVIILRFKLVKFKWVKI